MEIRRDPITQSWVVCGQREETDDKEGLCPFDSGLISIGWAAIFILGQADYKRMLAYSSVEHVGILALGVGIGAGAILAQCFMRSTIQLPRRCCL